jgi:O-antigen biosynthesis protein
MDGPRRIAIASSDIAGPYHCGGIGAAYHGLALELARAGHEVTVLYLHRDFHQGSVEEWSGYFRERGVRFVHLPQSPESGLWYASRKEASLQCYWWLRKQPAFDVIHFHEWLGLPYYSLLAKQAKLAFESTTLCVGTHGPMRWSLRGDEVLFSRSEDLTVDYMERKSVEMADVAVSPSQYLLRWMQDEGWVMPPRSYVANYILERSEVSATATPRDGWPIRELVFFGRLERRKGLPFFCDVLERLRLSGVQVTFLGSSKVTVDGKPSEAYLRSRLVSCEAEVSVKNSFSRVQALEYLHGEGRLAVIPSLSDNSPCTVQECLLEGIPLLASDRGGIPELVHPDDRERVTAPLEVELFAARIQEILKSGQSPAKPHPQVEAARQTWIQWHAGVARAASVARKLHDPFPISVCIAHYNRPRMLEQMLESIRRQTYPNLEVILVDDGSTSAEARSYLDGLKPEFTARGWQLLQQENAGPGVARDRAARAARGGYLVFADDDDVLVPDAIETFARVAAETGAEAFSCALMDFDGETVPASPADAKRLMIPLGPALMPGLIYPEFGGTLYMLKRDCYFAIGGFSTERDVDEDWELLLKVVMRGFRLQMIPEALLWYRFQETSRSHQDNRFKRNQSRIGLYEKLVPPELRDLVSLAYVRLARAPDPGSQKSLDRVLMVLDQVRRKRAAQAD